MLIKWSLPFMLSLFGIVSGELLTLSEAEHKAVTCSYEMRTAYTNEQAKEWEKLNAFTTYFPSVSYSAGFNHTDKTAASWGVAPSPAPLQQNSVSHTITLNQPISNGGAEIFAIRIARETKKAIELQMKDSELDAIYNTRKAYFDCIVALEQDAAARDDLSWTQQNLNKAKIRHQGGGIPLTDVLQWESEAAQKENNLALAIASHKTMLLNLFHTQGISVEKMDTSVEVQSYEVFEAWYSSGFKEMVSQSDSNLQLQALKHYTIAAAETKKVAMSKFLPQANAFVSANWPNADQLIPENKAGWTAGVSLNLTLFSGFQNGTNLRKVNYEYQKTVIEEQKIENQLKVNLERIRMFYKAAYEGVGAAKIQRNLFFKQLQLMQERYDGGLVNQSQLLEVALGSRMARVGYIQKLLDCLLLESEFLKNTGKLEVAQ